MNFSEINRMQSGGSLPVRPTVQLRVEKTTNGNATSPVSESPVVSKPLPAAAQLPVAPVTSPETPTPARLPPHQFRRPADVFDSKLYQPMKLSEKVFIPVKDYPKVGTGIKIVIGVDLDISPLSGNVII